MKAGIQEGDLVVIVAPKRCGCSGRIGMIFRVNTIGSDMRGRCSECRRITYPIGTPYATSDDGFSPELSVLRRIPPLSELEREKKEETA